jgi:hypothetical protein
MHHIFDEHTADSGLIEEGQRLPTQGGPEGVSIEKIGRTPGNVEGGSAFGRVGVWADGRESLSIDQ